MEDKWDGWLKQMGGTTVLVVAQLLQGPKTNKVSSHWAFGSTSWSEATTTRRNALPSQHFVFSQIWILDSTFFFLPLFFSGLECFPNNLLLSRFETMREDSELSSDHCRQQLVFLKWTVRFSVPEKTSQGSQITPADNAKEWEAVVCERV